MTKFTQHVQSQVIVSGVLAVLATPNPCQSETNFPFHDSACPDIASMQFSQTSLILPTFHKVLHWTLPLCRESTQLTLEHAQMFARVHTRAAERRKHHFLSPAVNNQQHTSTCTTIQPLQARSKQSIVAQTIVNDFSHYNYFRINFGSK